MGRDFLPRGSGIVTRRPLVLQLIQRKPEDGSGERKSSHGSKQSSDNKEGGGTSSLLCLLTITI